MSHGRRRPFLMFVLAVAAIGIGCGSSAATTDTPPPPAGAASAEGNSGGAVYLVSRTEGDRILVDVMARGAADVHGAAFRIHFDPASLALVDARASDVWSRQALRLAVESRDSRPNGRTLSLQGS